MIGVVSGYGIATLRAGPALRDRDREFHARLVTESGMTARQREPLMKAFGK